jgi:two-component system CheB/CheR fusion protein
MEEMESSKEELQSLNEELVTVNSELQGKNEELLTVNSDMRNLLNSTEIPTIFLDNELRVKRFTAQVTKIINLIDTDLGRPLSHIVSNLKYEKLIEDVKEVLTTLTCSETEVETEDGQWYFMRILPYRTIDNVIDGAVVIFSNIHEQKMTAEKMTRLEQTAKEARDYAESIVDTVRESLVVLDQDLRVVSANRSFYSTFQVTPEETLGAYVYDLGEGEWNIPRLRQLLEEIIPKNHNFENFEVSHKFSKLGHRKMLLNARRIFHKTQGRELILLALEAITDNKIA